MLPTGRTELRLHHRQSQIRNVQQFSAEIVRTNRKYDMHWYRKEKHKIIMTFLIMKYEANNVWMKSRK